MCCYLKIPVDFRNASKHEIIDLIKESPKFGDSSECFPSDFLTKRLIDMKMPLIVKKDKTDENNEENNKISEVSNSSKESEKHFKINKHKESSGNLIISISEIVKKKFRRLKRILKKNSAVTNFFWLHAIACTVFLVYIMMFSS